MRIVILGHLQRGGAPTPEDRILAAQTGHAAALAVAGGETGKMAGVVAGKSRLTPFEEAVTGHKPIPAEMLSLISTLGR